MKLLFVFLFALVVNGCGNDQTPDVVFQPAPDAAYEVVAPIVAAKCQTCHNGSNGLPTFADAAALKASKALGELQEGSMPPAGATKLTDDEKQKLLAYLSPAQ